MGATLGRADITLLERCLEELQERQDHRAVIELVERWAAAGSLTRRAVVAEARSFLALRLMDRAWVRLQEVASTWGEDREVVGLTARMFVERGWPVRARRLLEQWELAAQPWDAELDELARLARQPPRRPPEDARELERSGNVAVLLALADGFLCAGSFLRARGILDQLLRLPGAPGEQVRTALWALGGDFVQGDPDPVAYAWRHLPTQEPVADSSDLTESLSTIEFTPPERDPEDEPERTGPRFPELFRELAALPDDFDGSEVTSVSVVAAPGARPGGAERPSASNPGDVTRILTLLGGEVQGPAHVPSEDAGQYDLKSTLNLAEYRASMGVAEAASLGSFDLETDGGGLEHEDAEIIVMTRKEEAPLLPLPPPRPIEVVETPILRGPPVPPPPAPRTPEYDAASEAQAAPAPRAPVRGPAPPSRGLLPAALATLGLALAVAGLAWAATSWRARDAVLRQAEATILGGGFVELRTLEQQLAGDGPGSPGARGGVRALVQISLWADHLGDDAALQEAGATLAAAAARPGGASAVALADAYRLLAMGDATTALAGLAGTTGPLADWLAARAHLELGDVDAAASWANALADDAPAGALVTGMTACVAAAHDGCTERLGRALAAAVARHPERTLDAYRFGLASTEAVRTVMDGASLSPRQAAAGWLALGRAATSPDTREAALIRAAAEDPTGPAPRAALAAWALSTNRPADALREAERCLGHRPLWPECTALRLQALLELDRTEAAERALEALPTASQATARGRLLRAWVAMWTGKPDEAEEALSTPVPRGLAAEHAFLAGWAGLEASDAGAAAVLAQAADGLLATDAERLTRLAPWALAIAATGGSSPDVGRWLVRAEELGSGDAVTQVWIGRALARNDRQRLGQRYVSKAEDLGRAVPWVQRAAGTYHAEVMADGPAARRAWEAYLALRPTGAGADWVRAQLTPK